MEIQDSQSGGLNDSIDNEIKVIVFGVINVHLLVVFFAGHKEDALDIWVGSSFSMSIFADIVNYTISYLVEILFHPTVFILAT